MSDKNNYNVHHVCSIYFVQAALSSLYAVPTVDRLSMREYTDVELICDSLLGGVVFPPATFLVPRCTQAADSRSYDVEFNDPELVSANSRPHS